MKVLNSGTLSVCANGLRGPDWKEKEVEKDVEKEGGEIYVKNIKSVFLFFMASYKKGGRPEIPLNFYEFSTIMRKVKV